MKKQTLKNTRKGKKIVGGGGFQKVYDTFIGEVDGKFIPDNIEQAVLSGRKIDLIDKYKRNKDIAEKRALEARQVYDEREKNIQIEKDRNLKFDVLDNTKSEKRLSRFYSLIRYFLGTIWMLLDRAGSFFKQGFFGVFNGIWKGILTLLQSESPFVKLICLIIVIAIIIGLALAAFGLTKATDNKFDFKKSTSTDIFTTTKIPTFSNAIGSSFTNMMPEKYRISYNSIINNFSKAFGNDIVGNAIDNQIRETKTVGNWDGIYHVQKESDAANIYSVIKPTDIKLEIDINDYQDSDYFKLPIAVREKIFSETTDTNITIPAIVNTTGRYTYKFENAYYGSVKENKVGKNTTPFVDDVREDYYIANTIPLNNYTFTDSDNMNTDIIIQKIFTSDATGKRIYPMDYINKKIKE